MKTYLLFLDSGQAIEIRASLMEAVISEETGKILRFEIAGQDSTMGERVHGPTGRDLKGVFSDGIVGFLEKP